MKRTKKVILVVQGEGRGHMTQAISLAEMLESDGTEISAVLVGCSSKRIIPGFFHKKMKAQVIQFQSPNFVTDKQNKSILIAPSLFYNLLMWPVFAKSLRLLHEVIEKHKPDAIINFYDPLIGLYYFFNKPGIPLVCIAHQYIFLHPFFQFPQGHKLDRIAVKLFSRLTSIGSAKKLAISLYPMNNWPAENIEVVPPLLRKEVFEQEISKKEYYLIYLLNDGYKNEIIAWHQQNQHIEAHCFCDMSETYESLFP